MYVYLVTVDDRSKCTAHLLGSFVRAERCVVCTVQLNYTNLCVNSCWELYGAKDAAHLPSGGSLYDIQVRE